MLSAFVIYDLFLLPLSKVGMDRATRVEEKIGQKLGNILLNTVTSELAHIASKALIKVSHEKKYLLQYSLIYHRQPQRRLESKVENSWQRVQPKKFL